MKTILRLLLASLAALGLLLFVGSRIGEADLAASITGSARTELQALARLQTDYFAEHGRYATDLEDLDFVGITNVDMRVDGESWAATAEYVSDRWLMGFRVYCATVVGTLAVPSWGDIDMRAIPPGEVRCETE